MITRLLCTSAVLLTSLAIALPNASAQTTDIFTSPTRSPNFPNIPDFNNTTNQPGVTTSTITVNDSVTVGDLEVFINGFDHTWAGDLIATIRHQPTGRVATLFNRINRGNEDSDGFGPGDSSNFLGDYVFSSSGASLWTEAANGSSGVGSEDTINSEFNISDQQTYANVNSRGVDNNTNPNELSSTSLAAIFGPTNSDGAVNSFGEWTVTISDNNNNEVGSFTSAGIRFTPVTAVPEPGTVGLMAVAGVGGLFYVRRKKKKAAAITEAVEA